MTTLLRYEARHQLGKGRHNTVYTHGPSTISTMPTKRWGLSCDDFKIFLKVRRAKRWNKNHKTISTWLQAPLFAMSYSDIFQKLFEGWGRRW
jgi:hypothetical protein